MYLPLQLKHVSNMSWNEFTRHGFSTLQGQFCDRCNSNDPNKAHPVTNAIDGTENWWQSPPLSRGLEYNEVNVTLDLGQVSPTGQSVWLFCIPTLVLTVLIGTSALASVHLKCNSLKSR